MLIIILDSQLSLSAPVTVGMSELTQKPSLHFLYTKDNAKTNTGAGCGSEEAGGCSGGRGLPYDGPDEWPPYDEAEWLPYDDGAGAGAGRGAGLCGMMNTSFLGGGNTTGRPLTRTSRWYLSVKVNSIISQGQ